MAYLKEKKAFNIYTRQVTKGRKKDDRKKYSSLISQIFGEFENVKKENKGIGYLGTQASTFQNSFYLGKAEYSKKVYGIFFGDTHFTRGFTYKNNLLLKKDYFKCFYENFDIQKKLEKNISRMLYSFDFVGVNLETSVSKENECGINNKAIKFRTEPKYLKDFKDIGINLFNLANNHSYDCGKKGFNATKKWLKQYNLNFYGSPKSDNNILKKEINGLKIAFVGINTIHNILDIEQFEKKIRNLKKNKYLVIINIHWGTEFSLVSNKKQRQIAKRLVNAGANLIVGHHPHSVQDYEVYAGVPIFYSLGNFFFDQHFQKTLRGQGLIYELSEKGIKYSLIDFERNPRNWNIKCDSFK